MISFRLTADEYQRFYELCFACGAKSISELARAAINTLLQQRAPVPREALEYRVSELEGRMNVLNLELKKLYRHNASVPAEAEYLIDRTNGE